MISLEQIQSLELKVGKAVELIRALRAENRSLHGTLDSTQGRVQELERLVGEFKNGQREIETCVVRALENLDHLEDELSEPVERAGQGGPQAADPAAPPAAEATPQQQPAEQEDEGERELDIF